MKITVDLADGNCNDWPTKEGIDRNIKALERAIAKKKTAVDDGLLIDTKSIMTAIKAQLI